MGDWRQNKNETFDDFSYDFRNSNPRKSDFRKLQKKFMKMLVVAVYKVSAEILLLPKGITINKFTIKTLQLILKSIIKQL